MKTALNQLEKWILDYEKVNGTPTMCEIKAQIEMFKEVEKEQIMQAVKTGMWETEIPKDLLEYGENYFDSTFGDSNEGNITFECFTSVVVK